MALRFRYQRVLDVKGLQKDLKSMEASHKQRLVQEAKHRVDTLNHQYDATRDEMRYRLQDGHVQVGQLAGYSAYLFQLERNIRMAEGDLRQAERRHHQAMHAVVAAKQEAEVFLRLKERNAVQWKKEQEDAHTAQLDEVGAQRHLRRARNGEAAP